MKSLVLSTKVSHKPNEGSSTWRLSCHITFSTYWSISKTLTQDKGNFCPLPGTLMTSSVLYTLVAIYCYPLACPSIGCQEHPSSSVLPSFQQEGVEQAPSLMVNLSRNPACTFLLLFNQHLALWTKVRYPKARICCHFCSSECFSI